MPAIKRREGIIDWKLVHKLFVAGISPEELIDLPELTGKITLEKLRSTISSKGWNSEQKLFNASTSAAAGKELSEKMKVAQVDHYEFMLQELNSERKAIRDRPKTDDAKEQTQRLNLLEQYLRLAEKSLRLESNPQGPMGTGASFAHIYMLQTQVPDAQQFKRAVKTVIEAKPVEPLIANDKPPSEYQRKLNDGTMMPRFNFRYKRPKDDL